jgi:hypothetical protein
MRRFSGWWLVSLALLAGSVVVLRAVQHPSGPPAPALPEEDWDIPRIVAHLKARGVELQALPTYKDGPLFPSAFFLTAERDWSYLNRLPRDPRQIDRWQGIVFCGPRGREPENTDVDHLWEDCYFIAGRFFFFGDRALLRQIREALCEPALEPVSRWTRTLFHPTVT